MERGSGASGVAHRSDGCGAAGVSQGRLKADLAIECKAFREEDGLQPLLRQAGSRRRFWTRVDANSAPAPSSACSKGHLPRAPGRAGVAYLGSSEIGYSLRVRGLLGAGSRSALPLRFSVIFEYGGLIP